MTLSLVEYSITHLSLTSQLWMITFGLPIESLQISKYSTGIELLDGIIPGLIKPMLINWKNTTNCIIEIMISAILLFQEYYSFSSFYSKSEFFKG